MKLTSKQVKEIIKCRKNPIYFLRTYGKVRHPTKGLLKFDLWDFQDDCIKEFLKNSYNIILKARQLGLSTLCAGYVAWMITFFKDKEVYILATKAKTATNLVAKVKVFLANLPVWMQPEQSVDNRQSVELKNGSKVQASGTTKDAARSEALSLLIVDEAAIIRGMDDIWIAAQPTLSTGGDCIALSTPEGMGNWFHKQYSDAIAGQKIEVGGKMIGFNPIKLHWSLHPDRDDAWAANERRKLGTRAFAQEHDCDFLQSGNNVIDPMDMKWYEENPSQNPYICEPIMKEAFDKNFWIWRYPQNGREYIISADVARGDGNDYSAAQVIDTENYEQVAEYKGKLPTDLFGKMLVQMAMQYNNALLVVENNNNGWASIQKIIDLEYSNIYWSDKTRKFVDSERSQDFPDPWDRSKKNMIPGFTTSSTTRPLMIQRIEEDIRNHDIIIHSSRLTSEFETFVFQNGKPEAMDSYNDDLIMALAIGVFIRGTSIRMNSVGGEIQKVLLESIGHTNSPYDSGVIKPENARTQLPDYFKMNLNSGQEDLRWLL